MNGQTKTEYIRARATPQQWHRISKHCTRLGCSMGSRILELLRQDILAHHHFDLGIDVGNIRRPRGWKKP